MKHIELEQNGLFKISLSFEDFMYFLKCFTSCILQSLTLSEHEKLIFEIILSSSSFDWGQFKETFNVDYLIFQLIKNKTVYSLNFDVSKIISLFKIYSPLLLVLHKTNNLILINILL